MQPVDAVKKIEELQKQLAQKDQIIEDIKKNTAAEINEIKEKTSEAIKEIIKKTSKQPGKNTDDIAPGIRKQNTFGASFKNGYADGTVKKEKDKIKVKAKQSVQK